MWSSNISKTTQPAPPQRADVAKRVCTTADALRRSTFGLIDAIALEEDVLPSIKRIQDDLKAAETAIKDWEKLPPEEDSTEDMIWRQQACALSGYLHKEVKKSLESKFPEQGATLALETRKRLAGESGKALDEFKLGSQTVETLKRLVSEGEKIKKSEGDKIKKSEGDKNKNEVKFEWSFSQAAQTLTCSWQGVMRVQLKFSQRGGVVRIRVSAHGEEAWPSEFDVFRELERQAQKALREFTTTATIATSWDNIASTLVSWFHDRRDLFTARCAHTNRYLVLGAVGEQGQLEVRPPMVRTAASGNLNTPVVEASFT